jgi:hypothetical protein
MFAYKFIGAVAMLVSLAQFTHATPTSPPLGCDSTLRSVLSLNKLVSLPILSNVMEASKILRERDEAVRAFENKRDEECVFRSMWASDSDVMRATHSRGMWAGDSGSM